MHRRFYPYTDKFPNSTHQSHIKVIGDDSFNLYLASSRFAPQMYTIFLCTLYFLSDKLTTDINIQSQHKTASLSKIMQDTQVRIEIYLLNSSRYVTEVQSLPGHPPHCLRVVLFLSYHSDQEVIVCLVYIDHLSSMCLYNTLFFVYHKV